jgi:hypothetical protein
LTGSILGVVGILLRTQTHGLHQDEDEEQGPEERLPLQHNEESAIEVLGEAVSPAVLEEDRTRDYHARHNPPAAVQRSQSQPQQPPVVRHATFMSVMRAAAGADKLRVRGCVWMNVEVGVGMNDRPIAHLHHSSCATPPNQRRPTD